MKQKQIQFIREKVIMANNPECKTYEKALEKECVEGALIRDIRNGKLEKITHAKKRFLKFGESITTLSFLFRMRNEYYEILGLPLTLERLFMCVEMNKYEYFGCERQFFINHKGYICIPSKAIKWQPNKLVESQSEETIKAIAEVLGFKD